MYGQNYGEIVTYALCLRINIVCDVFSLSVIFTLLHILFCWSLTACLRCEGKHVGCK